MPIHLNWGDVDETFLILNFDGQWSGEDLYTNIKDFFERVATKDHPIELMVDMRQSLAPPQHLVTMLRSIINRPHDGNVKRVVVIVNSNFWQRIFSVIAKSVQRNISKKVTFVETVDEAYSMLDVYQDMYS